VLSLTFQCLVLASGAFLEPPAVAKSVEESIFRRENLVAWCVVPFDAKRRGPAERVAMLKRAGIKRLAWDWRAEHLAGFDEEVTLLKAAGIELTAVWFPAHVGPEGERILAVLRRHRLAPQLWVMLGDPAPGQSDDEKVRRAALALEPVRKAAESIGGQLALYNHGGWFGEPENQLKVIDRMLKDRHAGPSPAGGGSNAADTPVSANSTGASDGVRSERAPIGIVYNLHHGHDHLDRFPKLLEAMKPRLLALNLNGMEDGGDRKGRKILPIGAGARDRELLKRIRESGWRGPVGVLGHTMDDAELRLLDNLDGLTWALGDLDGKPLNPPAWRTPEAGR
jgi:hypothetical protein